MTSRNSDARSLCKSYVFVLAIVMLMILPVPARSQNEDLLKILDAVDQTQRPQLARRLRLFIEYQRKKQWDEVYKLIDQGNAQHWREKDFATMMAGFGYIDFVPTGSATDDNHGWQYRVFGCVKVRQEQKPIWLKGGLVAYLQGGDWKFTPYYLQFDRGSSRIPCESTLDVDSP
ncbi:MAG TPA: hypothetical protein VIT88_00685 [Pyrinomonadaceae bacterium]